MENISGTYNIITIEKEMQMQTHGSCSNRIVLNMKIPKNTSSMSLDVGGRGSTTVPVKILFARPFSIIVRRT